MKQKIYQIDAFTSQVFGGNPAAVCPLESWLSDELLQKIALENNLSETAFYVKQGNGYELRWFTPAIEVNLCGHATLSAAFVLFNYEGHRGSTIEFYSPRSGKLTVNKQGDWLTLNFPTDNIQPVSLNDTIKDCFAITPQAVFQGDSYYLVVFADEDEIKNLTPDFSAITKLDLLAVVVTAKGYEVDFVSRCFAPKMGVDEDPVTGSAHTLLVPYWANVLNKTEFSARQLSARQGYLKCKYLGDRVEISGQACLYLTGELFITD